MARGRQTSSLARSAAYSGRNERQAPIDPDARTLDVTIAKAIWRSKKDDFAILACEDHENDRRVIVKGAISAKEGERLRVSEGRWRFDERYGWSFQVFKLDHSDPVDETAVRQYLESLAGIGPALAEAIVADLGKDCLAKIDADPRILGTARSAGGHAIKREDLDIIAASWQSLRAERRARLALGQMDLSEGLITRIIAAHGDAAPELIADNPYVLSEIPRVGFRTADRIAQQRGITANDPRRLAAGVEYTLSQSESDGHCYMDGATLIARATETLGVLGAEAPQLLESALAEMMARGRLVREEQPDGSERIYTAEMFRIETGLYTKVLERTRRRRREVPVSVMPRASEGGFEPTDEQWAAVTNACREPLSILTGGPGVGKTSTLEAMISTLERHNLSYELCAPTGKAARRMAESTGREAHTIHSLLGWGALEGDGAPRPIEAATLIVDEASMIDIRMAERLLEACGPDTNVVMVGDPDQLPPVGAGAVFLDLIASKRAPTTRLTKVFRQAEGSLLLVNAHRVREGKEPYWSVAEAEAALGHPVVADWEFDECIEPSTAAARVVRGADPSAMVISPTRQGDAGVNALNKALQRRHNPDGQAVLERDQQQLRLMDRVLITKNDARLGLVNGDVGQITAVSRATGALSLELDDGRSVTISRSQAAEVCQLGYALTVHKSQGSQAPTVVCPVTTGSGERMLSRNLLYTAWTRAQSHCRVIGSREAIKKAITIDGSQRNTALDFRLQAVVARLRKRGANIEEALSERQRGGETITTSKKTGSTPLLSADAVRAEDAFSHSRR